MSLLVIGVVVLVVLFVLLNPNRWRGLARGSRAFGRRFEEELDEAGPLPPTRKVLRRDRQRDPADYVKEPIVEPQIRAFRDQTVAGMNLVGFKVVAPDGSVGVIDGSGSNVGAGYLVLDAGPWIGGKKVVLPAGVIFEIDPAANRVLVDRTKEEILQAPEFDEARSGESSYRRELDRYWAAATGTT
jgi:hypothetical protein